MSRRGRSSTAGRQLTQSDYDWSGLNVVYGRTNIYDAAGKLLSSSVSTARWDGTWTTSHSNHYVSNTGEYLLGAVWRDYSGSYKNGAYQSSAITTNTYQRWSGAVQATITTTQGSSTTTTDMQYDSEGALRFALIKDGRKRRVYYRTNAEGQIIHRGEEDYTSAGDPHETWYRFGGREWGYVGNNGTWKMNEASSIADRTVVGGSGAFRNGAGYGTSYAEFSQGYDPINSYNQGGAAGGYTVQRTGESLAGIAQGLWGDASLWYKLAEANGLSAEAQLIEGQRLTIPAGVVRNTYNAQTVKPYDPAAAIGDVSPSTPLPPKKKGCGILGAIFLAIIAVAVTAVLRVPIAKMFAGMGMSGTVGAGTALAGTAIGASSAAGIAGLAGAAMVGSVVSQGIGLATGLQDKFSFGAVAMAGIGAAVGGVLGGMGVFDKIGSPFLADIARGALTSAITQGIGVATGLQDKFSWAGVAAAGVGSMVGGAVTRGLELTPLEGNGLSLGNIAGHALAGTAEAMANAATRSAIEGSNFGDNIMAALPDTIGSVIGRALGGAGVKALKKGRAPKSGDPARSGSSVEGQPVVREIAPGQLEARFPDGTVATGTPQEIAAVSANRLLAKGVGRKASADLAQAPSFPGSSGSFENDGAVLSYAADGTGLLSVSVLDQYQAHDFAALGAFGKWAQNFGADRTAAHLISEFDGQDGLGEEFAVLAAIGAFTAPDYAPELLSISASLLQRFTPITVTGATMPAQGSFTAMRQAQVALEAEHPIAMGIVRSSDEGSYDFHSNLLAAGAAVENRDQLVRDASVLYRQGITTEQGEIALASLAGALGGVPIKRSAGKRAAESRALSPFTQRYLTESGGRWGGTATRQQNYAISQELEARGYSFPERPGGGLGPEEYIPGSGSNGGTYVDITGIAPNGRTVRIQTVTTRADGVTTTASEAAAAARIRAAFPNDKLLLVPKR